jgi:hypothetical protein
MRQLEPTVYRGIAGRRPRRSIAALLAVSALAACGEPIDPQKPPPPGEPEKINYVEVNGYQVPERENTDAGLPDSCSLLTEADPRAVIQEPLAPISRMSDVCLAFAESTPQLEHSLTVELRRPVALERERGPQPSSKEKFFEAEGAGIGLIGGTEQEIQEIPGIGDYAVWYPMTGGLALHAYWNNEYILAINVRGVDQEKGLSWAKAVAKRAVESTASTGTSAPVAPPAPGASPAEAPAPAAPPEG